MKKAQTKIWDDYSDTQAGTKGIRRKTLLKHVLGEGFEESVFKRAFFMLALNDFLCPTTSDRLSVSLLPACILSMEAKDYDWCSFVLKHLMHSIENFGKRFYADGFAPGCGGCTLFLAVLYLDRLNRPPVEWGVYPRVKVWCKMEVDKALDADEFDSGDFGKVGCVDVAYEENHPVQARDRLPDSDSIPNGVVFRVISSIDAIVAKVLEAKEAQPNVANANGSTTNKVNGKGNCAPSVDPVGENVNCNGPSDVEPFSFLFDNICTMEKVQCSPPQCRPADDHACGSGKYFWGTEEPEIHDDLDDDVEVIDFEMSSPEIHGGSPNNNTSAPQAVPNGGALPVQDVGAQPVQDAEVSKENDLGCSSRPQRKTKTSSRLSLMYEYFARGEAKHKSFHGKLISFVTNSNLEPARIHKMVMIKCNGVSASLDDCSTLICSSFSVHPNSAVVESPKGNMGVEFSAKFLHCLNGADNSKLNMIFVPVLQGVHWWCAAFSLVGLGEIAILDSSSDAEDHHLDIIKLKLALDDLMKEWQPL